MKFANFTGYMKYIEFSYDYLLPNLSYLSKYLILTSKGESHTTKMLNLFKTFHIYNVAIASRSELTTLNPFHGNKKFKWQFEEKKNSNQKLSILIREENSTTFNNSENLLSILYPINLRDINKFKLNIAVPLLPLKVIQTKDNKIVSKYMPLVEIFEEKMNAGINMIILGVEENVKPYDSYPRMARDHLLNLRNGLKIDLNVERFISFFDDAKKLNIYDQWEACFLVTTPSPEIKFQIVLLMPFDKSIWIGISVSLVVSAVIWKLFRTFGTSDSHWRFLFSLYGIFLFQGVKMHKNHLVLMILLQIFVFVIYIFGNLHQGMVTSFKIQQLDIKKFKTFEELLESDYKIAVTSQIDRLYRDTEIYQAAIRQNRLYQNEDPIIETFHEKFAMTHACELIEYRKHFRSLNGTSQGEKYLVQQRIFIRLVDAEAGIFNPYILRFQELMDWSFEAGLPKAWNLNFKLALRQILNHSNNFEEESSGDLTFSDIAPMFLILIIGSLTATFVLLIEIFHHDFISELSLEYFLKKLEKFRRRKNFKIIQVQPKRSK